MAKITFEQYCNQPAFSAFPGYETGVWVDNVPLLREGAQGLTRLEYFTAKAMLGIISAGIRDNIADVADRAEKMATEQLRRVHNLLPDE